MIRICKSGQKKIETPATAVTSATFEKKHSLIKRVRPENIERADRCVHYISQDEPPENLTEYGSAADLNVRQPLF